MAEVTRKIFDAPDIDGTANELASALPQGRVWEAKNSDGTNMRALVGGAAMPFNIAEQKVEDLPDPCLSGDKTIAERRAAIIERFRRIPVVTIAEMQAAVDALFPDVDIELRTGTDYYAFECEFEIPLFGTASEKFVIVARVPVQEPLFEYDLELEMTGALNLDEFRCYMEKIIPANVYFMIEEINPDA